MDQEVLMIPEDTSFMIEAYVESPGWVSVIPRGYLVSEWAGRKWKTPLLPQMFYGAAGEQLTTWRQYIPKAGWQVVLSRRAADLEFHGSSWHGGQLRILRSGSGF